MSHWKKMKPNFWIKKSHGGLENFSQKKLFSSLQRAGLPSKQCRIITDRVSKEVHEGSKTKEIYRKTLKLVKQTSPAAAIHYSLKRAIFELGPSGHHFEVFVARYFQELGYKTQICQNIKGHFVNHEVDVIAEKDGKKYFVECKFHNRVGIKNDIKIALYVKARWDDLKEGPAGKDLTGFYLASNTAFSLDALVYAKGTNLKLLGVNAPVEKSFLEEIKIMKLYPITSLRGLNKIVRNQLLDKGIILAQDIPRQANLLFQLGMHEDQIEKLMREIENLKEIHS
jgi:hypothetical protein